MNIKQAKQEIIDTVQAYLLKNEYDEYVIPRVHQRPVLLLGAPVSDCHLDGDRKSV